MHSLLPSLQVWCWPSETLRFTKVHVTRPRIVGSISITAHSLGDPELSHALRSPRLLAFGTPETVVQPIPHAACAELPAASILALLCTLPTAPTP